MSPGTVMFFLGAAVVLACVLGWIVICHDPKDQGEKDE